MDYSGTLRRGWDITWRNKWLILLTFLPLLVTLLSVLISLLNSTVDPTAAPEEIMAMAGRSLLVACVTLILYLLGMLLNLVTHGSRIAGVARVARREETSLGQSWREGWRAFPRLLGLALLLYVLPVILFTVAMIAVLIPLMLAVFASDSGQSNALAGMGMGGLILVCCLYLALLVVILFVALVFPFASRGIVLRNLGVTASIRHGWQTVRENLGQIILLALPFVIIYFLFGLIFGSLFFFLAYPNGFQNAVMTGTVPATSPWLWVSYLVYLLPASVLATWQGATVTLGYLHWTGKDVLGATITPPDMPPTAPLM